MFWSIVCLSLNSDPQENKGVFYSTGPAFFFFKSFGWPAPAHLCLPSIK